MAKKDAHLCFTPYRRSFRDMLDKSLLHGKARGSAARGDLQLGVDGAKMGVDGGRTDEQMSGDLRISQPLRYQPQDLDLAGSQVSGVGGSGGCGLGARGR
jgi:hypothetical protein